VNSSLCRSYLNLSREVCSFLENVKTVGEESITDFLIWKMKEINKNIVHVNLQKFSRNEESKVTGADFEVELWIVEDTKGIPLVIQAKKAIEDFDGYCRKLNYFPSNRDERQVTTLIKYCEKNGKLPFYLFYAVIPDSSSFKLKCEGYPWKKGDTCLILVDAYSVKRIADNCEKNKKLHKTEILKEGNPFCCLFCCPLTSKSSDNPLIFPSLGGIKRYLSKYYPLVVEKSKGILQQIPKYVLLLKEKGEFTGEEFLKFRSFFLGEDGRLIVKNLVVISLDNQYVC